MPFILGDDYRRQLDDAIRWIDQQKRKALERPVPLRPLPAGPAIDQAFVKRCPSGHLPNSTYKYQVMETNWPPLETRTVTIGTPPRQVQVNNNTDVTFQVGQWVIILIHDDCTADVLCCVFTNDPPVPPDPPPTCTFPASPCPPVIPCNAAQLNADLAGSTIDNLPFTDPDATGGGDAVKYELLEITPWEPLAINDAVKMIGRITYVSSGSGLDITFTADSTFTWANGSGSSGTFGVTPVGNWSNLTLDNVTVILSEFESFTFILKADFDAGIELFATINALYDVGIDTIPFGPVSSQNFLAKWVC